MELEAWGSGCIVLWETEGPFPLPTRTSDCQEEKELPGHLQGAAGARGLSQLLDPGGRQGAQRLRLVDG